MELAKRNIFSQVHHSAFRISLFLLAALLVFSHSVTEPVDHDEHQFVASAALLARRGLLPYRDYPYLHTPYLVFFDAAVFRLEGSSARLLLTARLLSAACGIATVMLLAAAVQSLYRDHSTTKRWATIAAVLLLLTNPLFTAVIGLAWNHDAGELLLFAATLCFLRDVQRGSFTSGSMLAAGALLGLSIGVRLTVAPAAAAFAGWALADARVPWRRRFLAFGLLLLGIAVALAPCAWLFLQSPRGFLFGNFGYPTLNTAYRIAHDTLSSSTTPAGKIAYFLSRIVFSSGTGFLLLLIALTAWLRREKRTSAPSVQSEKNALVEMRFLGLLILFLLAGSFAQRRCSSSISMPRCRSSCSGWHTRGGRCSSSTAAPPRS